MHRSGKAQTLWSSTDRGIHVLASQRRRHRVIELKALGPRADNPCMGFRRVVVAASAGVALAVLGAIVPAQAFSGGHFQGVPVNEWHYPGTTNLDGVGGWVYVEPESAPGPGQLSRTGYVYEEQFFFVGTGSKMGAIGLSNDTSGPVVGLRLIDRNNNSGPPPVTLRYPWAPGRVYFLLAYGLGGGTFGGWVYDLTAAAWTFIGTIQAPTGWGGLAPVSAFTVHGAEGLPLPSPFAPETLEGVADCAKFPKADAWFYEPVGWRGSNIVSPSGTIDEVQLGDCPARSGVVNGWHHYALGILAPA